MTAERAAPQLQCRGCGSADVLLVVDLGAQPAADHFPPADTTAEDPRWPLALWFCRGCRLVQLGPVDPQLPEPPLAIESETSRAHAETSVKEILRDYPELVGASVCEFASHHGGSWLDHLSAAGCRVASDSERADLVVDVHALAHETTVGESLRMRADQLAPGGLLVLEFHHLLPLFQNHQFDTIRHGHWSYLSLGAVIRLAGNYGLTVTSVRTIDLFGGSLQVMLRHVGESPGQGDDSVQAVLAEESGAGIDDPAQLSSLQQQAHRTAAALRACLTEHRSHGRTVLGYGAPSKAPVLLGLSGIGPDLLPFTVDASPGKHGRRIPGCGVPIRPVEDLRAAQPAVVLVLTWDIVDEVMSQLEADGGWGATYLVPLPQPHVITR